MAQATTAGTSESMRAESKAREAVIATALAMSRQKLSPGRSGNVSMRFGEGMLITPSGMAYDKIEPDDVAYMAHDGSVRAGSRKPSSEWHFHLAAYAARPDRHALVHTHSLNATVLACARRGIPAFHYMVAAAGGTDIPLVPYATFGTQELAVLVAVGLAQRDACLLANHGVVAIGRDLAAALELAGEVEVLAEQYLKVLSVGPAHVLSEGQMAVVLEKFKDYGQR
jgi:L-fuculose-phosphate aldolase